MKIRTPFEDYPPDWKVFDHFATIAGPYALGFDCAIRDVNRFAARYKAAKSFRRVEFDSVTAQTADGYSALCQLLFTYSTFEHFLQCIGTQLRLSITLLSDEERDRLLTNLRQLNGQRELFTMLRAHLDRHYQKQIDSHLSRQSCNPFYLAGALRHAFAHGLLTASPQGVPPESVATVSRFMCKTLMKVMDREFSNRMDEFVAGLP
jgi:hypothetical protein